MPFTSHKTAIHASAEQVWELMIDKIRRPDKYVPGVVSVEVLQEFSELSIERSMTVQQGDTQKTVREIIWADPNTMAVIFKLKDDPDYTGYVLNMVFEEDGEVQLDITMHWTEKDPDAVIEGPDWEAAVRGAVMHTKELAEG
ncbi:AtaL-like protein [Erythrobacter rubeus]|uniref:DUF1857 family protein n=1 Tax=Erythrobacter rubeus TaxID=2760803 RepID=A0ABR8KV48_9SPHN|nr:AtaL-like protein [Erythrobacter rubeus]MBD2843292.1 DUF1857 family protein [Erythrobacter rubeus]